MTGAPVIGVPMTGVLLTGAWTAGGGDYSAVTSGDSSARWFALLALALLIGFALARRRAQDARRQRWERTDGEVVDEVGLGYGGGDSTSTDKVIVFRTVDGREIQGVPLNGVSLGTPVIGRRVPVWYDPAQPQRFEARVHRLDRAGSFALLIAIIPAVVLIALWLP